MDKPVYFLIKKEEPIRHRIYYQLMLQFSYKKSNGGPQPHPTSYIMSFLTSVRHHPFQRVVNKNCFSTGSVIFTLKLPSLWLAAILTATENKKDEE